MKNNEQVRLQLQADIEKWPTKAPFHITGYTFNEFEALVVTLREGDMIGVTVPSV